MISGLKRHLAFVLVLAMLVTMLPVSALAEEGESCAHPSTEAAWDTRQSITYTPATSSQHDVSGYQYIYCTTCFERLSTYSAQEREYHSLDANGYCALCGYSENCEHTNTAYRWNEAQEKTYTQQSDTQHLTSGYRYSYCTDCGDSLTLPVPGESLEGHTFNDLDTCIYCQYSRGCSHNIVWEKDNMYTSGKIDEAQHRVRYSLYPYCTICKQRVGENKWGEEIIEDHNFGEGDRCDICGYTRNCRHLNTYVEMDRSILPFYKSVSDTQHAMYVYEFDYCRDCYDRVSENRESNTGLLSDHTLDEAGACTTCDFGHGCAHKNTSSYISSLDPPRYEQYNETQHFLYHTMQTECSDCHSPLSSEEAVTTEAHVLSGGICTYCGYGAGDDYCTHPTTEIAWDTGYSMTYTSQGDGTHLVEGYQYHYCTVCFKRVSSSFPRGESEAHTLDSAGDCTLCNFRSACTHAETVKQLLNTLYESLDSDFHEVTTVYSKVCAEADCGKVLVSLEPSYTQTEKERHTFDKNTCIHCGYTVADSLAASVSASCQNALPGATISASASVEGGTGGYRYSWKVLRNGAAVAQTDMSMGASYSYTVSQEGTYVFQVTVTDSSGTAVTARSGSVTVAHAHDYKTVTSTELINQDLNHHDVVTTTYEECTVCGETTQPVTQTVSQSHSAERYGYEEDHPHRKFLVCRCGARPYVEGEYQTANGSVQEPEVCCVCHDHVYGEQEQDASGNWQHSCIHCGLTQPTQAPAQPGEPGFHYHNTVINHYHEAEHPHKSTGYCSVCGIFVTGHVYLTSCCECVGSHDYGVYYDSQLNAHTFCLRCEPRTEEQMERDLENLERYLEDAGMRANADSARNEAVSMSDEATMILKALHDRVDGVWNWEFWAGWMYKFATFSPSGAIKQILPGSQNVNNIRKQAIQSAIISAYIAESRSNGVLSGSSHQEAFESTEEDLPESVKLTYSFFMDVGTHSVTIYEAILTWDNDAKASFKDAVDWKGLKEGNPNKTTALAALKLLLDLSLDIGEYQGWSAAQKELFYANLNQGARDIAFLTELMNTYPDDDILVEYCEDTIRDIEVKLGDAGFIKGITSAGDKAGDYLGILATNFAEVGTDIAVPTAISVMLGLTAKVAGGVAIVGGFGGFLENVFIGTGTTSENYEDIEVLYEVLEQSFYAYREAEDDPDVSEGAKRFQEFYMLYLKMAGLEMAGQLNKGAIRDITEAALDTCEKYEQQMLYE